MKVFSEALVEEARVASRVADLSQATIGEVLLVAQYLEKKTGIPFIRMDQGSPGLPPNQYGVEAEIRQTNHEGVLVDWIQQARGRFDGIVLNPAAYTHTSVALLDAVQAVGLPTVEVHLSDPDRREPFRRVSYVRAACLKTVSGRGFAGYLEAMDALKQHAAP